jgi:hypothetical protein
VFLLHSKYIFILKRRVDEIRDDIEVFSFGKYIFYYKEAMYMLFPGEHEKQDVIINDKVLILFLLQQVALELAQERKLH